MSDIAIRAKNLSKLYRIGGRQERYKTLRDTLAGAALEPVRRLRSVVRGNGSRNGASETIWALKDVSFEIKRGEVVGIIGRNGAGKSTLLKILSRITEPTTGRAEIYGRVGSLLEVGTGFHPELTGRENVYLNGAILGMRRSEIERRFDEIVEFAEIEKFLDTPVKHYSSGMYMRLAFSVAAHLEPEILLVDEVLAVGDTAFQKKCLGKMGEVSKQGRTVLFVSHNMGAISELCESAIFFQDGRLLSKGHVEDVVSEYVRSMEFQPKEKDSSSNAVECVSISIDGTTNDRLNNDEGFSVTATISVAKEIPYLRANCILLNDVGSKVFHLQTDMRELGLSRLKPGWYEIRCTFPPLWLSPGVYTAVMKFRVIGSNGYDGKVESTYLPVVVSGDIPRFSTLVTPKVDWSFKQDSRIVA